MHNCVCSCRPPKRIVKKTITESNGACESRSPSYSFGRRPTRPPSEHVPRCGACDFAPCALAGESCAVPCELWYKCWKGMWGAPGVLVFAQGNIAEWTNTGHLLSHGKIGNLILNFKSLESDPWISSKLLTSKSLPWTCRFASPSVLRLTVKPSYCACFRTWVRIRAFSYFDSNRMPQSLQPSEMLEFTLKPRIRTEWWEIWSRKLSNHAIHVSTKKCFPMANVLFIGGRQ